MWALTGMPTWSGRQGKTKTLSNLKVSDKLLPNKRYNFYLADTIFMIGIQQLF